jgi:hypothetical protein
MSFAARWPDFKLEPDRHGILEAQDNSADGLWSAVANALDRFTPVECRNYLLAAGYHAT